MLAKKTIWVSFICCTLFYACAYDQFEEEVMPSGPIEVPDSISYTVDVAPIIAFNCSNEGVCHKVGSFRKPELLKYADVVAIVENGKFQNRVFDREDMPDLSRPEYELSAVQYQILRDWIDQGTIE